MNKFSLVDVYKKNSMNKRKCIVVTSTVYVDNSMALAVKDVSQRLFEYKSTIYWLLQNTDFDYIVFCDNSEFDFKKDSEFMSLDEIAKKFRKKLILMSFMGDTDGVTFHGKGYGEGLILEYVFRNDKVINESEYFYKITGRLTISNVDKLTCYRDSRSLFIYDVGKKMVDTRFYRANTMDFKRYLLEAYKNVWDSKDYYIEHAYFDAMNQNKVCYGRFLEDIGYVGRSGTTGVEYFSVIKQSSIKKMLYGSPLYTTYLGRSILRILRRITVKE